MAMMLTLGSPMTGLIAFAAEEDGNDESSSDSSKEYASRAESEAKSASDSADKAESSVSEAKKHVGGAESPEDGTERKEANNASDAADTAKEKKDEAQASAEKFNDTVDESDQEEKDNNRIVVEDTIEAAEEAKDAANDAKKAADAIVGINKGTEEEEPGIADEAAADIKSAVDEAYHAEADAKLAAKDAAEVVEEVAEEIAVQTVVKPDGTQESQVFITTRDEQGNEIEKNLSEATQQAVQDAIVANTNVQKDMKELLEKDAWDSECDELLNQMKSEQAAAKKAKDDAKAIYDSSVKVLKDTIESYNEYARQYELPVLEMDEVTFELKVSEVAEPSGRLTEAERTAAMEAGFGKYSTEVESILNVIATAGNALSEAEDAYNKAHNAVSDAAVMIEEIKETADAAVKNAKDAVTDANSAVDNANEVIDKFNEQYHDNVTPLLKEGSAKAGNESFETLESVEEYNHSYDAGSGSVYQDINNEINKIMGLNTESSIKVSKIRYSTGTREIIRTLLTHAKKSNEDYLLAKEQYLQAENTINWAESLNKEHQVVAYVQHDKNGQIVTSNIYDYDLNIITSNTQKHFEQISSDKMSVPYTMYRDFVNVLYKDVDFKQSKNNNFISVGKQSDLYLKGITEEQGTLKAFYWEIGDNGKLTEKYFTDVNDLETGRYFYGYSFKVEENDGLHLDGYCIDYVKPVIPPEDNPGNNPGDNNPGNDTGNKTNHDNKTSNTTSTTPNVTIDDPVVPLAAFPNAPVISDEPVALAPTFVYIDDDDVALSSVLMTGDESVPLVPLTAVGSVMIGTAYLISTLKRRPRK